MQLGQDIRLHAGGNTDAFSLEHDTVLNRKFIAKGPVWPELLWKVLQLVWPATDDEFY